MTSCPAKQILSNEEEEILARVRALKEQRRRARIEGHGANALDALRHALDRCREELRQANRDKWRRLGYEL